MRSRAMDRTALQTLVRVQGRPCRRPVRLLGRACSASCDAHAHACVHAHGSADDAASARQHAWTLCAAAALLWVWFVFQLPTIFLAFRWYLKCVNITPGRGFVDRLSEEIIKEEQELAEEVGC